MKNNTRIFQNVFTVNGKPIGNGRVFIVAEIGSNHNQDMQRAKELIDVACEAGADAVKFQSIDYDALYTERSKSSKLDALFEKIELQEDWHAELVSYCQRRGVVFTSAPTYLKAVEILESLNVEMYKIASPQAATYPQLIEAVARTAKPVVMSTGYASCELIDKAVRVFERVGNGNLALLHCVSEYPTLSERAHLRFMKVLKDRYGVPVGFSDHTLGYGVSVAAAACGADIIEKHITLSRDSKGPDHHFALEPRELEAMVKEIRVVEKALGVGGEKQVSEEDICTLQTLRMRAVAARDLAKGCDVQKSSDILYKRDAEGIDAWDVYEARCIAAKRDIVEGEVLSHANVKM